MRYFFLDTLGDLDRRYAVLTSPPEGLGVAYHRMARGERAGAAYPEQARIFMDEDDDAIEVPSIVGNTLGYLVGSEAVKREVESACPGADIEYLPFTLYNSKKRPHPGSYFIINPIGARDCLERAESQIEYLNEPGDPYDGAVVGVDRFVLDPAKLQGAPSLFRIREEPNRYVVDEQLAGALREKGLSNVLVAEIEQRGEAGRRR